MCDTRRTVTPLTIKSRASGRNVIEDEANAVEVTEEIEKKERSEGRRKCRKRSTVFHSVSLVVLHVLDTMLLIILLPFIIWQWASANDRLKLILKAVVEVTLELIMWVIFAGVSILMTTTFVLEDIYHRRNDHEEWRLVRATRSEATLSRNETWSLSRDQEKLKIPEDKD